MATAKTLPEVDKVLEPVRAFNQLALDNCAKLVEMNLDIAKRYTELTLANVRELVELKDPAAVQAYVAKQPEAIKSFADTARADAEAALKLSMSYFEEAGKLVASNAKKAA
jgi:phasin family protein